MNPKHANVRLDRKTGELWLTEERLRKPVKRVANITSHVYLALASDLMVENGTENVTRDIKFADGSVVRITVENIKDDQNN